MIFYPKFGSYTPMFSIPDKIDEFRVICFIFATFAKSLPVLYRCFHCESVWLTISVYGSFSQRRKHNNVSTCCYFQQVWHVCLPLCSPLIRHSQLSNQSQKKYFWKHIQLQVAKLQTSCCSNLRNIYSYI